MNRQASHPARAMFMLVAAIVVHAFMWLMIADLKGWMDTLPGRGAFQSIFVVLPLCVALLIGSLAVVATERGSSRRVALVATAASLVDTALAGLLFYASTL